MKATSMETAESSTVEAPTAMETSAEPAAPKPSAVETTASAVTTATLGKTGFWDEAERESHRRYGGQSEKEGAGHGSIPPTYLDTRPERIRHGNWGSTAASPMTQFYTDVDFYA